MLNVISWGSRSLTARNTKAWLALLLFGAGVALVWGFWGVTGVAIAAGNSLPDGRAWEMVSPLDKGGGDVLGIVSEQTTADGDVVQASADGQRITYVSTDSFLDPKGAPYGSQYVSGREAKTGWSTQNISTLTSNQTYELAGNGMPYRAFSTDLSVGIMSGGNVRGGGGVEGPSLAPGAPAGYENYYLYGISTGARQSLVTCAPGVPPGEFALEFLGGTSDLGHVVVSGSALGECGEVGHAIRLYEWEKVTGQFQPVSVLPNGSPAESQSLGDGAGATGQAISEDGSKVIWTGSEGLYVREGIGTPLAGTVQLDASRGGPEPGGGGEFRTASSDGSKVFFTDGSELTSDAHTGNIGCPRCGSDLYEFDVNSDQLRDVTVDHVDANGAEVLGTMGASADGSYVYFVANGVLSPGASPGTCKHGGASPPGAVCNLYLWHEGWERPKFIATLSGNDNSEDSHPVLGSASDWSAEFTLRTARVSRDGLNVVFMSQERLKTANFPEGYDNTVSSGESCGPGATGPLPAQCEEVFLYEATAGRLTCVSCNPTGAPPTGPSGIPGATKFHGHRAAYQSRVLSEGGGTGRVFFDSADGLVARDTNRAEDVYEYENGHVYLLSDGRGPQGASFVDASMNGDDAFFITRAELVGQDTDRQMDLYDARAPHEPGEAVGFSVAPIVSCEGEDCLVSGSAAPSFAVPSSFVFMGGGNVAGGGPQVAVKANAKKKPTKKKPRRRRVRHGKHRARARAGVSRRARVGAVRIVEGM
ncbi:MAG TPA: hypothetical protein VGY76_14320 [Solirubrobacteraceae bacterium]|nr:hypothetical protein [Solirubrobacteraceae bacterium]